MVQFGTYHVWIEVDGDELPEFNVDVEEDKKKVTCWIPSEAGKEFTVHYESTEPFSDGFPTKSFDVHLDGIYVWGSLVQMDNEDDADEKEYTNVGHTCGENGAFRKFLFAACQLTDEDDILMESQTRRVGEIEAQLVDVDIFGQIFSKGDTTLAPLKIHEKAKKGIVHGAQLGELVIPENAAPFKVSEVELKDTLATFVFRYRPRAVLQANGIAPPLPPAPTQQTQPDDVIDLTLSDSDEDEDEDNEVRQAEIAALKARIDALERKSGKKAQPLRKRVMVDDDIDVKPVIKRERLG